MSIIGTFVEHNRKILRGVQHSIIFEHNWGEPPISAVNDDFVRPYVRAWSYISQMRSHIYFNVCSRSPHNTLHSPI